MDKESLATLRTVITAGHAREGYIGDRNARLQELADEGLLTLGEEVTSKGPRRTYAPTAMGRELIRQLAEKGVA